MMKQKKKTNHLTKEDLDQISKIFRRSKLEAKLDVILNFMSEIKADLMVTKRMLYFLTKNKLSYKELTEFARISKVIDIKEDRKS